MRPNLKNVAVLSATEWMGARKWTESRVEVGGWCVGQVGAVWSGAHRSRVTHVWVLLVALWEFLLFPDDLQTVRSVASFYSSLPCCLQNFHSKRRFCLHVFFLISWHRSTEQSDCFFFFFLRNDTVERCHRCMPTARVLPAVWSAVQKIKNK